MRTRVDCWCALPEAETSREFRAFTNASQSLGQVSNLSKGIQIRQPSLAGKRVAPPLASAYAPHVMSRFPMAASLAVVFLAACGLSAQEAAEHPHNVARGTYVHTAGAGLDVAPAPRFLPLDGNAG